MRRLAAVLLALAVLVVVFGPPRLAVASALVAVAGAWSLDRTALRAGLRAGMVLAILFAAAVTAAVVAWADGPERGIETGGLVLLRLLVLVAAAAVLVRAVDADSVLRFAERLGMPRLGLVLGLALNSLPRITEAAGEAWTAYRVRYPGILGRLRHLPGVGEALLAHTARIADEAAAAASLRGHRALTHPGSALQSAVRTVVVTGPPDGGKTRSANAIAELLRGRGVAVAGFLQLGIVEDGRKVGFKLRDVASGDEAEVARLDESGRGEHGTRFRFFERGFELARSALEGTGAGSVVVIDELGPVELRGGGHMPAVRRALARRDLGGAVIVVRRALVPALLAALDATDAVIVDVEEHGKDSSDAIAEALRLDPRTAPAGVREQV